MLFTVIFIIALTVNAYAYALAKLVLYIACACSNVLHILRPAKAPGFAYAWLELVSHRLFVGRVLAMTGQQRVSPLSVLSVCHVCPFCICCSQL